MAEAYGIHGFLSCIARTRPVADEFPTQRPVTRSWINGWVNNREVGDWWSETPSRPLWRHCNDIVALMTQPCKQPGCRQAWYWPSSSGIFRVQHQKGQHDCAITWQRFPHHRPFERRTTGPDMCFTKTPLPQWNGCILSDLISNLL